MGGCCGGSHNHKPKHNITDHQDHGNQHNEGRYSSISQTILWVGLILVGIIVYRVYSG